MKRLTANRVVAGFFALGLMLFVMLAARAVGTNSNPLFANQALGDMDAAQLSQAWTNLGGGAVGKLGLDSGCFSSSAGNLTINIPSCLGFTPFGSAGGTLTGALAFTTANGISAAGSTQGTATAITAQRTVVSTVSSGQGVILSCTTLGADQAIWNTSANQLLVYPCSSAAIGTASTNAAVGVAAGGFARFTPITSTQIQVGS